MSASSPTSEVTADRAVARFDGPSGAALLGGLLLLGLCWGWSHARTLLDLWTFWQTNQDYSVGMLVAPVALWLAWRDRTGLRGVARPWAGGLLLLGAVELLRHAGTYYGFGSIERLCLVLSVAAGVLTLCGPRAAWRLSAVLAFLLLMLPLPGRVHEMIAVPLQGLSTRIAATTLELLGYFVVREGNVLRIDERSSVGVTEACSGLRMLTAFAFTACVIAFVIQRPRTHRLALLAASVPIAVISNSVRTVATAIFAHYSSDPSTSERFHDVAGLAMMPLGILLSLGLLGLLKWLDDVPAAAPAPTPAVAPASSRPVPRARRSATAIWTIALVAAVLLAAGGASQRALAARVGDALDQVVDLPRPLRSLALQSGGWTGQDVPVSEGVQRIARNDDFINRSYVAAGGEQAGLFVGYTAQPRTMLRHRPTICYPSAGWTHVSTRKASVSVGGRDLPVLVHRFLRPGLLERRCVVVNYYVLQGDVTVDEGSFWSLRWRAPGAGGGASRYVAQVQVVSTVQSDPDAAENTALRFAAQSAPEILALLPGTPEFARRSAP